jgi:hypothetical protein
VEAAALSADIAIEEYGTVIPADPAELTKCLADPVWRLSHLYKIITKEDEEDEGTVVHFRPNRAQRRFIARLWHRNIILKARQLGFTTLVCILWLDHALFNSDQRCGVIAHNDESALNLFRDKVGFAYDSLPPAVRTACPTKARNEHEILFAHNNSSIRVATSMRSGTIHRLLISEYGKICAQFPKRAIEVQTGSLPAVPLNGITIIESTAEGQDGDFYKKTQESRAIAETGRPLNKRDFRFHFYAWWMEPKYRIDPSTVIITSADTEYIEDVEVRIRAKLEPAQWAWYFATKRTDLSDNDQLMWREYPSYPEEAFKVSIEGTYYALQLQRARKEGRIGAVPYNPAFPVNTFWDLGLNDLNVIGFHQKIGAADHWIDYYENSGEGVSHYVTKLQERGYTYGMHHLPHDGAMRRVTMEKPETYEDMLRKLGVKNIVIVPRISHITTGIQNVRDRFNTCWFDEKKCAALIKHLQNYRKEWNTRLGTWNDHPRHDVASNGADMFRQWAQGYRPPSRIARGRKTNWRTA